MDLHPIFKDCEAKELTRYSINRTWVKGGYACATDGRICVRTKVTAPDSETDDGMMFPSFESLPWPASGQPGSLAELPDIPDAPIISECTYCCGLGYRTCDMDCEHDCPDCDTKGVIETTPTMKVGDTHLRSDYIRILRRHGATVYTRGDSKPAYFTVGDVEGLLMRCNPGSDGAMTAEEYAVKAAKR